MQNFLTHLPRKVKAVFWIATDASLVPIALFAAFGLRLGSLSAFPQMQTSWPLFPPLVLAGVVIFSLLGLPRIRLHSFDAYAMRQIGLAAQALQLLRHLTRLTEDQNPHQFSGTCTRNCSVSRPGLSEARSPFERWS